MESLKNLVRHHKVAPSFLDKIQSLESMIKAAAINERYFSEVYSVTLKIFLASRGQWAIGNYTGEGFTADLDNYSASILRPIWGKEADRVLAFAKEDYKKKNADDFFNVFDPVEFDAMGNPKAPKFNIDLFTDFTEDKLRIRKIGGQLCYFDGAAYSQDENQLKRSLIFPALKLAGVKGRKDDIYVKFADGVTLDDRPAPDIFIPFANGTLRIDPQNPDLAHVQFSKPDPDLCCLNAIPWNYDPNTPTEDVDRYLAEYVDGDPAALDNLGELQGMFFSSRVFKTNFLLQGDSDGGKSSYMRLIKAMLGGADYERAEGRQFVSMSLKDMGAKFRSIELKGRRGIFADDVSRNGGVDDFTASECSILKLVLSHDYLMGERKGKDPEPFKVSCPVLTSCNTFPPIRDKALRRRFRAMRFPHHFRATTADPVKAVIADPAFMSGLILRSLQGYFRILQRDHDGEADLFTPCDLVNEATEDFLKSSDLIEDWLFWLGEENQGGNLAAHFMWMPGQSMPEKTMSAFYRELQSYQKYNSTDTPMIEQSLFNKRFPEILKSRFHLKSEPRRSGGKSYRVYVQDLSWTVPVTEGVQPGVDTRSVNAAADNQPGSYQGGAMSWDAELEADEDPLI